jgi:type IV pilus assembly protein PilQ
MMRRVIIFIAFIGLIFYGCANKASVKQGESISKPEVKTAESVLPEITSLEVSSDSVTINVDSPFEYTVYKPGDPFKTIVELKGVKPGKYTGRIEGEGKISEMRLSYLKTPVEGTRIEITLAEPSEFSAEYGGGRLVLKVISTETEQAGVSIVEVGPSINETPETEEEIIPEKIEIPEAEYVEEVIMSREGDKVMVTIKGDGRLVPDIFPLEGRLVIDLPGVDMRAELPKEVIKPLRGIRWGEHEDKTRIVLDLEPNTSFDVVSIDDRIDIALRSALLMSERIEEEIETKAEGVAAEVGELKETPEQKFLPERGVLEEGKYRGRRISLDFQNADIVPIFRLLADVSGYNIVVDPKVKGKITMKLINVPWDQALDIILKTHKLDKVVEGNIIRIAPAEDIAREREAKARMLEAQRKAEPLITQVFPISYADVKKVKSAIVNAKILSERGSVSVDERISSIIVKDIESNMPKIEQLIKTLDKPTPQVMIEARIVEVNTNVTRELGIRWGINTHSYDKLINLGGLTPYMVDFPSGAGAGSGSGITFGFLNKARTLGLDLEISALETSGKLKIVSNPRIITIDNQEAMISQGKSIPVRKLTSEGTVSTEYKDVKLELKVKPHITPDGSIILKVEAKKEELDPTVPSVEGVPGTDKKEAKTKVIIKDGETLVIGGIYKTVDNNSSSGVPGAKDIPIIGWLFKNKKKEKQTNELLIFITPRILKATPKGE